MLCPEVSLGVFGVSLVKQTRPHGYLRNHVSEFLLGLIEVISFVIPLLVRKPTSHAIYLKDMMT